MLLPVMASQIKTNDVQRKRPSSAHPSKLPRTSVLHWRNKIERTVSQSGTLNTSFSVRIEWRKRRVRFPLDSANKNTAASKAAEIFKFLLENGWDETIAKYKPTKNSTVKPEEDRGVTVGELLQTVSKYTTVREQTFLAYTQAFRKIVSDITGVSSEGKHQTTCSDGNKTWKTSVDATPLREITPVKVQQWRQARINQSGKDASSKRKATVTANSQIRNAKTLFSKKLLPFIQEDLELPSPLPFDEVQAEKVGSMRYHSEIDAEQLMRDADQELKEQQPEAYTIFLLALVCGLRVSEIDNLLWDAVDLDRGSLHVRSSEHHLLKSEDSEGIIDLGDIVSENLSQCVKDAKGEFVITVGEGEQVKSSFRYRCQTHLNVLIKWLRGKGVKAQKPIHTLRKEIGSLIASEQGIFAASRYLRHADIQVTAAFYADKKNKVVPSIGNSR